MLLLHLYIAWRQDPELLTSVPKSKSAYKTGSRYNALHISYKIVEVIDYLETVGLIHQRLGSELSQRDENLANDKVDQSLRQHDFQSLRSLVTKTKK